MTSDDNRADENPDRISRRKVIAALSSGAAVGLAGCGGQSNPGTTEPGGGGDGDGSTGDGDGTPSNGDGGTGTVTEPTGDPLDSTVTISQPVRLPTEMQWNPYHQEKGVPNEGRQLEFVNMAVMLTSTQESYTLLLSDFSLDGKTATLEMNDWFTWTNGDPVTAQDLETQLILSKKMGMAGTTDITDVQQTGDYTVEMTLQSEKNPTLFWGDLFKYGSQRPREIHTPHSVFNRFREKFDSISTATAVQSAFDELGTWSYDEEPLGYGPYHVNPDRTTEEKMFFERNDDYPIEQVQQQFSEQLGYDVSDYPAELRIPEFEVMYSGERTTELVLSDTLDFAGLTTITPELRNQSPDHMTMHGVPVPGGGGTGFLPNLDNEHFGKRPVRQAIAHLIPYEQGAQVMYGDLAKPENLQTGLTGTQEQTWLSEEFRSNLNAYDRNPERAASILQDAGYSRDGGTWTDENGNAIEGGGIPIPASLSQKVKAFNAYAQQITDFGIPVEVQTTDWSAYGDMRDDRTFDGLAHTYMGGGPHPYRAYGACFGSTWWDGQRPWYEGGVEVPAMNGDGTTTIEPVSLLTELGQDIPRERQEEIVRQLVWVFNKDLPIIGLTFKDAAVMRTDDHWRLPPTDDKMSKYRLYWHLDNYAGLLQPQYQN